MLLFYEHEPNATECLQTPIVAETTRIQTIDALPHYGSHAFVPYLLEPQHESASSSSSAVASTAPQRQPLRQPLKLHNASTWTYSGPLLLSDPTSLPPSFHTWASATMSSPSELLNRLLPFLSFLQAFLSAAGAHHYWLTIRATKPTHEYDTPRWHTDDNFFDNDPEADGMGFSQRSSSRCWKLATNLLGPTTLFRRDNPQALATLRQTKSLEREKMGAHTCTSIRCLGCSTYADSVRQSLARSLSSSSEIESPAYGEVAFFRIGDDEGAVHSEPRCDADRIFVNVIPGTEQDLKDLMGRWGMGFPRAWCFGVPVGFVRSDERESFVAAGKSVLRDAAEHGAEETAKAKSTMSVNMGDEYGSWLTKQGFQSSQVFGHAQ